MSTVSDGLYQYGGVPVGYPFILQTGRAVFVRPSTGSDSNTGKSPNAAVKTLAQALSLCTANKNDVVYLIAESNTAASTTDYQSTALDWNKDSVHLIGINDGSMIGQRSRISNLSTATAITDGLFVLSANNCLIANIEVFQGQASTNPTGASIAVSVTGQRNRFINCQISGIGHSELDDATSRSLKVSGGENIFQHCYIGLDTIIRATATAEIEISAGARHIFEDCIINSYTSLSTFKAITCGSPDRFVILRNCMLSAIQNISSAVAPTGAIASGSINGQVMLHHSGVFGYADITTADDSKVYVLEASGNTSIQVDMGVAKTTDVA
jgi:hypothetical protein